VLAEARHLVSETGLASVTMRALAERLGVAPNALYSHVASKTALIDALLDDVLAGVDDTRPEGEEPVGGLERIMVSTYDVLLAHADLVPLFVARQGARGPNAHRLGDVMAGLLGAAGVQGRAASDALRVLVVYTIGFAAFVARSPIEAGVARPLPDAEVRENFTTGLRWLLAGIVHRSGA
jgi:AcrR family transcriptional regulator